MERLTLETVLKVIRASFLLQTKERMVQDFFVFTLVFQPILFTILTVGTYLFGGKPSFGLFAITGAGMMGIWNNNLWSSGEIVNHERGSGTLSLLIASPTPLLLVLLGKSLANAVTSILAMGMTFATGAIVYHLSLGINDPFGFLMGLILTVVALTCLGLVLGSLFVLTRNTAYVMNVANYPIYLLSGLAIPLTILPVWTRPFSDVLAPTWGNLVLNQAAGSLPGSPLGSSLWLIGLSALYLLIALGLYKRVEYRARQAGNLEMW
jgi:ABC-2 type transport system permease protein